MLVLTRKVHQKILVGDDIEITIFRVAGNRVQVGVDAPQHIGIWRGEMKGSESLDDRQPEGLADVAKG